MNKGESGKQHFFALSIILVNVFNAYHVSHRDGSEESNFREMCEELADEIWMEYA